MVAYHFDFRIALVKGSPNTVAANATVLVYDPADTGYTTPVTVYADPALTTIINLVSDANGIVPDFYTNNLPDVLWASGDFEGQWATSQSRPGLRGPTGPKGDQGIQGVQGTPGLNGAGTNSDVATYVTASGPTRTALDARYQQSATLDADTADNIGTAGSPSNLAVAEIVDASKALTDADIVAVNDRVDAIDPSAPNTRVFGSFKSGWQADLQAKTRPVVAVLGDSIGKKFNASSVAASWVGLMAAELKALKGDGGTGFRGMADAGYAGGTFLSGFWDQYAADDKVTLSGSAWSNSADANFPYTGPGLTMGTSTTVGSTASFRVAGDTIAVYYLGVTSAGGTFTVTVDGVAAGGTISTGSKASNAPIRTVVKTMAGAGMHTVVVTVASSGLNLYGVSGENAAGAVVNNFSRGGVSATQVLGGTTAGADWNGGTSYPADLIIYALGINDLATTDVSATQVADHARKFLARLRDTGVTAPVLLVANHAGKRDVNARHVAVTARLREVAEAYGGAFVDLWGKYQNSWAAANAAGYWGSPTTIGVTGADDVHPSDTGHAAAWATIRPLLVPAV